MKKKKKMGRTDYRWKDNRIITQRQTMDQGMTKNSWKDDSRVFVTTIWYRMTKARQEWRKLGKASVLQRNIN